MSAYTSETSEESRYLALPDVVGADGTIADRLATLLEEAIVSGLLPQGMHLKAEALSHRYGVSMIPVREALRTLQASGWVHVVPHRGAFVRRGDQRELDDLFELRSVLEVAAAGLAAQRASSEDLKRLNSEAQKGLLIAQTEDMSSFARVNSEFHESVARATQNRTILEFQQRLNQRVRFYSSILPLDRIKRSVEEHAQLVSAISERNVEAAETIAGQHIGVSRQKAADRLP